MSSPLHQKILAVVPLLLGLIVSVVFIFFIGPDVLISYIGLQNAYLLMFVVSGLSGLSTFNSVPYLSVLLVLANAGVNPLLLGFVSALGVMTGDSFSFLIGKQGAQIIPQTLLPLFAWINGLAVKHPRSFLVVCFLYGSICPLSNDFITISSGMARIPYRKVMIPLALGNIVFNVAVAYLSVYAYDWMQNFFS